MMSVTVLNATPPWDWPENAADVLAAALRDRTRDEAERLLAFGLAGDIVAINDELVDVILATLRDGTESDEMRSRAAIALGPVLELADVDGFDDPDVVPITKDTFRIIVESLRDLYHDAEVPSDVRRRVLEAAIRAPQDWHQNAVRAAYESSEPDWKLTGVFAMGWVPGFEARILEALESESNPIRFEALRAAGQWGIDQAWPHVKEVITSEDVDKDLLLAAIEAAPYIRPREARMMLIEWADCDDEDIADAVEEAMVMTEFASGLGEGGFGDEDFLL